MEKYLELIKLCQKRNRMIASTFYAIADISIERKLLALLEELEVLAVYVNKEKYEIQLSKLEHLLLLNNEPNKYVQEDTFDHEKVWRHYEIELNGILFTTIKNEYKEEHKKAQAI